MAADSGSARPPDADPLPRAATAFGVLAALVAGVALRVHQLPSQIIYEDELFPLRTLLERSYAEIVDRLAFGYTSIPQTLIAKLLAETVGLDELVFRAPSLVGGLLLLGVVSGFAWRRFGGTVAIAVTSLLAISPLLVFYSRFARPYAISALLVFVAVVSFDRWLERSRPRDAIAYLVSAASAIWFHPLTAASVLAAPLAAAVHGFASARSGRRVAVAWPPLLVGGSVASLAGMLLYLPLWRSWNSLSAKAGSGVVELATLGEAAQHLAGTGSSGLAVVFWGGVAFGGYALWQRAPRFFWLVAGSVVVPFVAIWITQPFLVQLHWILARYLAWTLPLCLLLLALAIGELGRLRIAGRTWPVPIVATGVLIAALVASGPLPAAYTRPNGFTHHDDLQVSYWGDRVTWGTPGTEYLYRARRTAVPPASTFYAKLRDEPGEFGIVEGPWFGRWELTPFHHDQRTHGRPVVAGYVGLTPAVGPIRLDDSRLAFRQLVDLREPERWQRPGLRYAVLHRNVAAETRAPGPAYDMTLLLIKYVQTFGPPVFEDDRIVVFSIDPSRGPQPPAEPPPSG